MSVGFGEREGVGEAARLGDRDQIDAAGGVARLHAGLAVVPVVEHDDDEILRLLHPDGGERAHAHQHLAVAGEHGDAALGLGEREAEPDHGGAAHRAPTDRD